MTRNTSRQGIPAPRQARLALALAAAATTAVIVAPRARAEQTGDMVTISLSGATFMRNFTTSPGISLLTPGSPGTDIVLLSDPSGAPVVYKAVSGPTTSVQLAPNNAATFSPNPTGGFPAGSTAGAVAGPITYAGLRIEWHEQGSIEGVLELINDQVKLVPSVGLTNRNPSTGNPTWVNRNQFTAVGTISNFSLATSTYNPAFGGGTFNDSDPKRPGRNIQGGQNRVQMAISDVNARQGFASGSSTSAAWYRQPGQDGYGRGNQKLNLAAAGNIQGLGFANVRHELNEGSVANMNAGDINPNTGAAYGAGPWNTAGVDNLHNVTVANGGLTFIANPGTGLTRVNRSDAVWLHATGRLANGTDFNVATRDEFSGTINTGVTNVGLDVSWATGENDNGNGNGTGGGTSQTRIGPDIKFSNKTSGSSQVRPTVQNSRMGFGHLTSSESVVESFNSRSRPLRVMEYRDDDNDLADGSNNALAPERRNNAAFADPITGSDANLDIINGFTRMSAKSLVEGSYVLRTNQTYVTVKDPKAAFAGDSAATWAARTDDIATGTGIKGDNHNVISGTDYGNDVYDFRKNILDSVANFPAASVANPADELLARGFILPAFVKKSKNLDGLNQDFANPAYDSTLSSAFLGSSYVTAFNSGDPRLVKQGTSSVYGNNNIGTGSATPVGGSIPITSNNWIFGNFDQSTGEVRDYADLMVMRQAQEALASSGLGIDWNANAGSNATAVAGTGVAFGPTKGDLIVLGDYDSDGDFDGQDLYRFARGAALADNTSSTQLTAASGAEFGDRLRKGVLRKNAALDWLATNATAQQKLDARANIVNDPSGANAFNKRDVNRDGNVDFVDAVTSDKFFGKDYRNLDDQLAATRDVRVGENPTPISLVDTELNDTGNIDQADLDVVNTALVGTGKESWTGTLVKSGAGTVSMNYTGGNFTVASGSKLKIDAGTVSVGGTIDPFTDNSGGATNGNHVDIENNSLTSLNVTAGIKVIGALTGVGKTSVSAGATLSTSTIRQDTLVLDGTAVVRQNGAAAGTAVVNNLTFGAAGTLDLADNDLAVNNGSFGAIQTQVLAGFGTTGPGITSSTSDGSQILALFDNAMVGAGDWNGISIGANAVVGKYTYFGDANIDGQVTGDDYTVIDANLSTTPAAGLAWLSGDMNLDGIVTGDDYTVIDANLGLGVGNPLVPASLSAVPEPGSVAVLLLAGAGAFGSRRRRSR